MFFLHFPFKLRSFLHSGRPTNADNRYFTHRQLTFIHVNNYPTGDRPGRAKLIQIPWTLSSNASFWVGVKMKAWLLKIMIEVYHSGWLERWSTFTIAGSICTWPSTFCDRVTLCHVFLINSFFDFCIMQPRIVVSVYAITSITVLFYHPSQIQ